MLSKAINHMTAPSMRYDTLIQLAVSLGCSGIELRNDLPKPLFEGDDAQAVKNAALGAGIRILGLSQVNQFNDWSDAKLAEVRDLAEIATACGAETISLIPRNDGRGLGNGERQANLRLALKEILPLLQQFNLIALVEPLGFEMSSLRHKSEAVEAIAAIGGSGRFKLVHDTFHHHLAGGGPLFPQETGIVHISGVTDPALSVSEMRDEHRILVDENDRLGNVDQIAALTDAGYAGPISFEAFSPRVHEMTDLEAQLSRSFGFIESRLAPAAVN